MKGRPCYVVNDVVGFEARVPVREWLVIRGRAETTGPHPSQLDRAANGQRVPA